MSPFLPKIAKQKSQMLPWRTILKGRKEDKKENMQFRYGLQVWELDQISTSDRMCKENFP